MRDQETQHARKQKEECEDDDPAHEKEADAALYACGGVRSTIQHTAREKRCEDDDPAQDKEAKRCPVRKTWCEAYEPAHSKRGKTLPEARECSHT